MFSKGKSKWEFKHVCAGLGPALTLAPLPAVPISPSPRVPENILRRKPHSALAAAVFVSSMTGRVVGMPLANLQSQRPRSWSFSDTYSIVEPYGPTGQYLDGVEVPLSDGEESSRSQAVESRAETMSPDPDSQGNLGESSAIRQDLSEMYAQPNKNKHAEVAEVTEAISSEGHSNTQQAQKPKKKRQPEMNPKVTANTPRDGERPADALSGSVPDDVATLKGMVHRLNVLLSRYQATFRPLTKEERKKKANGLCFKGPLPPWLVDVQHMPPLLLEYDKELQQKEEMIHNYEEELHALREQMKGNRRVAGRGVDEESNDHAQEEVVSLNEMVHRLNVVLSRYQATFRPLTREENKTPNVLRFKGPIPPWLVDVRMLSPLILEYDIVLQEKEDIICLFKEELQALRTRTEKVADENEELQLKLQKLLAESEERAEERRLMREQAQLVVEENKVLLDQLGLQRRAHGEACEDTRRKHESAMGEMTRLLVAKQDERDALEQDLASERRLRAQLTERLAGRVSKEEHEHLVASLTRELKEEVDRHMADEQMLKERLVEAQAEARRQTLDNAELSADNKELTNDLNLIKKNLRSVQQTANTLTRQVEEVRDVDETATLHLSAMVRVAKNARREKSKVKRLAKTIADEYRLTLKELIKRSSDDGEQPEKLQDSNKQMLVSMEKLSQSLKQQEGDTAEKRLMYEQKIRKLQFLLQQRQCALDEVTAQERQLQTDLDVVFKIKTREDAHLQSILWDTLGKETYGDSPSPTQRS
ncbi:unnamed protein product [Lampetra fluviatilis]